MPSVAVGHTREQLVESVIEILPVASPKRHAEPRIDTPHARFMRHADDRAYILRSVLDEREHGHERYPREQSRLRQLRERLKPLGRYRHVRFKLPAERIVGGSYGHLAKDRRMGGDLPVQVDVPCDESGFCDDGDAEAVSVDEHERLFGEPFGALKGIVRVGHSACAYHAGFYLAAQLVAKYLCGVLLCFYGAEILHMVAVAPAVAVDTPVTAAAVEVHVIVVAEPFGRLVSLEYSFGGCVFHGHTS